MMAITLRSMPKIIMASTAPTLAEDCVARTASHHAETKIHDQLTSGNLGRMNLCRITASNADYFQRSSLFLVSGTLSNQLMFAHERVCTGLVRNHALSILRGHLIAIHLRHPITDEMHPERFSFI